MDFTEPVDHPSVVVGGMGFAAGYVHVWRPNGTATGAAAPQRLEQAEVPLSLGGSAACLSSHYPFCVGTVKRIVHHSFDPRPSGNQMCQISKTSRLNIFKLKFRVA